MILFAISLKSDVHFIIFWKNSHISGYGFQNLGLKHRLTGESHSDTTRQHGGVSKIEVFIIKVVVLTKTLEHSLQSVADVMPLFKKLFTCGLVLCLASRRVIGRVEFCI